MQLVTAVHLDQQNRYMKTADRNKLRTLQIIDAAIGGLALALHRRHCAMRSRRGRGIRGRTLAPLIFTVVLLVTPSFSERRAGILGTVLAALVFARFLFSPVGSIQVANDSARANLGWMLLIGIGFSFLFAPPTSACRRH